jgi:F-type H+-transporting ATPase subunit gamma
MEIAEKLLEQYLSGEYDRIVFIYHKFTNAVIQKLQVEQFLPVESAETSDNKEREETEFIFDPSKEEILQNMVPQILKTQFYKALLDSWASELGARMTAMSQATDNASELLKQLRLTYNKARQAAITKEILEIVGGAEALSKQ